MQNEAEGFDRMSQIINLHGLEQADIQTKLRKFHAWLNSMENQAIEHREPTLAGALHATKAEFEKFFDVKGE